MKELQNDKSKTERLLVIDDLKKKKKPYRDFLEDSHNGKLFQKQSSNILIKILQRV